MIHWHLSMGAWALQTLVSCKRLLHNIEPKFFRSINPFPPSVPIWQRLAKLSILILEGTIKKISYERRDYELVDEKSLS